MKLRPVLLLTGRVGSIPEVVVAYISSVVPTQNLPSDILIDPSRPEFGPTHLKTLSVVRLHKLATIHGSSLLRYLGTLEPATLSLASSKLTDLLGLHLTS